MYIDQNRVYLYDWELASLELPLWYDAFHFIFQQHILIQRSDFATIQNAVDRFRTEFSNQEQACFQRHYTLYLLFNCTYYLHLYACQTPLHMQAHWLVNTWQKALEEVLTKMPIKEAVLV